MDINKIKPLIKSGSIGSTLMYLDETTSTFDMARELANNGGEHGAVLITTRQTAGRGRLGRSFASEDGGLYMTVLLRPDCQPDSLPPITALSALCVLDAVESVCGLKADAKWPNDILHQGKKLSGIMTIGHVTDNQAYIMVGIGINANQDSFPIELEHIAVSLKMLTGRTVSREKLCAEVINSLDEMLKDAFGDNLEAWLNRYRQRCVTLGTAVRILDGARVVEGIALDVDRNAKLLVRKSDGSVEAVGSGEIVQTCQ